MQCSYSIQIQNIFTQKKSQRTTKQYTEVLRTHFSRGLKVRMWEGAAIN